VSAIGEDPKKAITQVSIAKMGDGSSGNSTTAGEIIEECGEMETFPKPAILQLLGLATDGWFS
jgi:hypothetical protein